MALRELKQGEKEVVSDILKYYKFVNFCRICGNVYGTDKIEIDKICPRCLYRMEKKSIKIREDEK